MLDRRVRQGRYPRKTVKIDVSVDRRNVFAMSERARTDKIIIRRCGKNQWISAHPEYARMMEQMAHGNPNITNFRLSGKLVSKDITMRFVKEPGEKVSCPR